MAAPMKTAGKLFSRRFFTICRSIPNLTYSRYSTVKSSICNLLKSSTENTERVVKTQGWVSSIRQHKDILFLHITDGSCLEPLQVIVDKNNAVVDNSELTYGCCLEVKGQSVASPGVNQTIEVIAETINILGKCDPVAFPFKQRKHHPLDYTRSFPHLRAKTKPHSSLLRVRNEATMAVHKYFQENGYCFIHTPILTTNDCEGGGEVFQVESKEGSEDKERKEKHFFNSPSFLTVSGQLHLEAVAGAFEKVYNFGPTFRAERSRGRHHLAEFYMIEAELSFLNNMEDLMNVMEDFVKSVTKTVVDTSSDDVHYFHKHVAQDDHQKMIDKILDSNFVKLSYSDAVDILVRNNDKFQVQVKWGDDLMKEHEKFLTRETGDLPVFLTNFPTPLKPFYARMNPDDTTVSAVDLLVPDVGELIGGSLREERYNVIKDRLDTCHLTDNYQWYLDLRKFGTSPHGGFGLGFERFLQFMLGVSNIKDVIPFPRSHGNCKL